jgi:hypothetical protein
MVAPASDLGRGIEYRHDITWVHGGLDLQFIDFWWCGGCQRGLHRGKMAGFAKLAIIIIIERYIYTLSYLSYYLKDSTPIDQSGDDCLLRMIPLDNELMSSCLPACECEGRSNSVTRGGRIM